MSAVLTIPEGFIADLQSGVRQPALQLAASRRSPIEADAITRRLEAAVYRLNQRLATGYVDQVLQLVDLVTNGGEIGIFGRTGDALGLKRSRVLVSDLQARLRAEGDAASATELEPLVNFIDETQRNLDLAKPAANAIRAPIVLEVTEGAAGREPLSAFGFAGALLVSLGLAGALLAAAAMSAEREDHALVRLRRGLISAGALVAEKMAFTATACLVVGLALLAGVAIATDLAVGRWGLWLATLLLAGLAFGAFGVLAGALARETRSALLIALMLALPLLALGLLPGSGVAQRDLGGRALRPGLRRLPDAPRGALDRRGRPRLDARAARPDRGRARHRRGRRRPAPPGRLARDRRRDARGRQGATPDGERAGEAAAVLGGRRARPPRTGACGRTPSGCPRARSRPRRAGGPSPTSAALPASGARWNIVSEVNRPPKATPKRPPRSSPPDQASTLCAWPARCRRP